MLNAHHWRLQAHVVRTVVDQPAALDQRIKCRLQNGREIVSVTAASNWKCPRWADDDQPVMHVRKTLHLCFGPYPLLHPFHSAMTSHVVCSAIWRERQGNFWQRKRHQLQPSGRHATSSPKQPFRHLTSAVHARHATLPSASASGTMRYHPAPCLLPCRVSIRQSSEASLRRMRLTLTASVCRDAANNSASSASASPQVARISVSCDTHPLARCSTRRMRRSLGVNAAIIQHAPGPNRRQTTYAHP